MSDRFDFDIIYEIMRDAVNTDGIARTLQRLIDIVADKAAKQPCLVCSDAAVQLAIALDNANVQYGAAMDAHALTEAVIRSARYV